MVKFDEESHTYTNTETNEIYKSATQLLGLFKKPFNTDLHSKRVAEKRGLSQEEILQEWGNITSKSIYKGKNIHKLLENYINYGETEKEWMWLYKGFDRQRSIICDKYDTIRSEKLLWNNNYKIAGTCDLIVDIDDEFCIWDFKTNKKMSTSNPYKEYLLEPIDFLQACSYNIYALQLSLYAFMYENSSYKSVRNLCIFYIYEDKIIPYHVPYLKLEIKQLLSYYKLNYIK